MDVARLVIVLGIGLSLTFFIMESLSLIYAPPNLDLSDCYGGGSSCSSLAASACNNLRSNMTAYNQCYSQEYQDCVYGDGSGSDRDSCLSDQKDKIENYQLISLGVFGIFGLASLILGFVIIRLRSIGSGLILGGSLLTIFASFISTFNTLFFFAESMLTSLGDQEDSLQKFKIIRAVLYFLTLFILVFMSYFFVERGALDKTDKKLTSEHY